MFTGSPTAKTDSELICYGKDGQPGGSGTAADITNLLRPPPRAEDDDAFSGSRTRSRPADPDALGIEALDETDAREQTLQRQMTPVSVSEQSSLASGGPRRRKFALLLFVQELHSLISAGLSITEALDALAEKEPSVETRAVLMRLLGSLRSGCDCRQPCRDRGEIFPPLLVGIVQAAEGTSDLPRALQRSFRLRDAAGQCEAEGRQRHDLSRHPSGCRWRGQPVSTGICRTALRHDLSKRRA